MNVLAWLDSLHTTEADGAVTNRKWPEAQEARAAVAELVEAAKPFAKPGQISPERVRLQSALARIAPNELHDKAAELRGRGE